MFNAHTFTVNLRRDNDNPNDEGKSNASDMLGDEILSPKESFVSTDNATDYALTKEEFETIELQGNYKVIKCNERTYKDDELGQYNIVYIDFTRRVT